MEDYLTTEELSKRIKMSPGTIRNLVWKKKLHEGTHYVKPTPRKLLFKWTVMENWLNGCSSPPAPKVVANRPKSDCLINI